MKLFIVTLIMILPNGLYSKTLLTNYQVIDSFSVVLAAEISSEVKELSIKSLKYAINEHAVNSLVEINIIESLSRNDISVNIGESQSILNINIGEVKVIYDLHSDNDSLYRKITFKAKATLGHNEKTFIIANRQDSFNDVVARANIPVYEDKSFAFTQGSVPEPKLSLFDKIIKPAVYITTAAVVILLLFTVRSN